MALDHVAAAACEARCDEQAPNSAPARRYRRGHAHEQVEQAALGEGVAGHAQPLPEQAPCPGGQQPDEEAAPAGAFSFSTGYPWTHAGLPCLLFAGEHTKDGRGQEGAVRAKEAAEMSFRRGDGLPHFDDVHKPASLPQDPCWSLEHTTLFIDLPATDKAHDVMNRCLEFFELLTRSALVCVSAKECSFKVRLHGDCGPILAKVKLYHMGGARHALEVHRRSGDAFAFHEMLPGLAGHLRGCLSPGENDWALAAAAEEHRDDLPQAALAPLLASSPVDLGLIAGGGFGHDADQSLWATAALSKSSDGLYSAGRRTSRSPCPPLAAAAGPAAGQPDFGPRAPGR